MISIRHVWATVLMAFVAISLVMAASSASAQATGGTDSVISDWSDPGSFPFAGNYSDVCALYGHEITGEQCARALDQSEQGLGSELYLQDGHILEVSFTVSGTHQSKVLRVDFGDKVSKDDPMRRAMVYDTGRSDGLKLVRPDICGNWSLMTIRREAAPLETAVATTQVQEAWGCWLERHPRQTGGDVLYLSSLQTCGGGCGQSYHIPGLLLQGDNVQSNGQGLVCGWIYR